MKKRLVIFGNLINAIVMLSLLASSVMPVQSAQATKAQANQSPSSVPDSAMDSPEAGNDISAGLSPVFTRPSFNRPEPIKAAVEAQATMDETPTSDPSSSLTETPSVEPTETSTIEPTASSPAPTATTYPAVPQEQISNSMMLFVKNVGQFDKRARFVVQGASGAINVADDSIWVTYMEPEKKEKQDYQEGAALGPTPGPEDNAKGDPKGVRNGMNLRFNFVQANQKPEIEGIGPQEATISYLLGNDSSQWYPDVPSFSGVVYKDLYPGVNLEVTSEEGVWKWVFVLENSSELAAEGKTATLKQGIRIHFQGPDTVTLEEGMIHILTPLREFILPVPEIRNTFARGMETVSLGEPYVDGKELVIPVLMPIEPSPTSTETPTETQTLTPSETPTPTSTETITVEPSATEEIPEIPTALPSDTTEPIPSPTDTPSQTPSFETSPTETPTLVPMAAFDFNLSYGYGKSRHGLAVPAAIGPQSPVLNSVNPKASQSGAADVVFSTYLDGSESRAIAVDKDGNTYVTGFTGGFPFPTTPGAFQTSVTGNYDAFVTKLNSSGTALIYSTYLGGSAMDNGNGIVVDSSGSAYVVGRTLSTNFPTTAGAYDQTNAGSKAFVTKLNSTGTALVYSTYLGAGNEQGFAVVLDRQNQAVVVGQSYSSNFPTTSGAYDRTYGGNYDGFITKFDASGSSLIFSTYFGGGGADCETGTDLRECGIDIDSTGAIYVAGPTTSTNFPTSAGAYDSSFNGVKDAFVLKMKPDGSGLIYSTYLGGSNTDCEEMCALSVDSSGTAYITGPTLSTNFPMVNAFDSSPNGGYDAFVAKVSPNGGTLLFSTYLGGSGDDNPRSIVFSAMGEPYITGSTKSSDYPVTADAYQPIFLGGGPAGRDAFITKFVANGNGLSYSTFLGGSNDELGNECAIGNDGYTYYTGWTGSSDFPVKPGSYDTTGGNSGYILKLALGQYTTVAEIMVFTFCPGDGRCGSPVSENTQGNIGTNTINSRTGTYDYFHSDFSVITSAGPLDFLRSYSSAVTDRYTGLMGYGWTHNHDIRLIFSGDPGGETDAVLFKGTSSNMEKYQDNGDGTYMATDGVIGVLTWQAGPPETYTLTTPQRDLYTFDASGKLVSWQDAQGHAWTYTYLGNGRLDRVTADDGIVYLDFGYDGQNRLNSVVDHTGRDISLGYDGSGDLSSFTDVNSKTWSYTYDGAHRLRIVTGPGPRVVDHVEYDAQGKAYQQYDPSGTLLLTITYNTDGSTIITDAFGNERTDLYDSRNTLVGTTDDQGNPGNRSYDKNLKPSVIVDGNSNPLVLDWSEDGANLTKMTDPSGAQYGMEYDTANNLRELTDARDFQTLYFFNENDPDPAKRKLLQSMTDANNKTTTFTYTTSEDAPAPEGLVETITDPLDHTTTFTYNAQGQRLTSTDDLGKTTSYDYDLLGRLQYVQDPVGRKSWTCYDPYGRVVRTVANATGDGGSPSTDPCDATYYVPSSDPDKDRITTNVYDDFGNLIATTDPAGVITRTYYDSDNRLEYVVQNLVGQGIGISTPPAYDSDFPDRNIRSQTVYDNLGNAIASIDTLGMITRTYYDSLNRPEYVVTNLYGQSLYDSSPPLFNPSFPDRNVLMRTYYDGAGNVIATKDNAGHITRTYYDRNNRPLIVVQNLTGWDVYNPEAPTRNPATPDQNLRTDFTYDKSGNTIGVEDPAGIKTRTYYDALNRPMTVAQNLYGQVISYEPTPTYDPAYPDRNVLTDTYYDDAGNTIASVDTLGVVTRTYYDDVNRPEFVVRNWIGNDLYDPTPPPYNSNYPDENVRTQTVYDDNGQAIATIDTVGHKTRTYYDQLGRPRFIVQNLTGQAISVEAPPLYDPEHPDQNVRTEIVYDARGDAIASIDNAGTITRTYYDNLHRARYVTQNLVGQGIEVTSPPTYNPTYPDRNVTSQTIYDGAGKVVRSIDPDGKVGYSCYDVQGRVIKAVGNPSVADPCGSYSFSPDTDRDIITLTTYDSAGNPNTSTDPNGKVTNYTYDNVYRLLSETDPLTHATSYTYDVAGNRVRMTDARNIITKFEYDSLGRLKAVVENFTGQSATVDRDVRTEYTYDGNGNRKTIKDGRLYITSFAYDDLNRLITETDPLNHTWTYGYDGLGNRTSLLDANGATTIFGFDALSRPKFINYPSPDPDVTFTYDEAGNQHTMVDGVGTTTWTYDDLNRPKTVNDPYNATISYEYKPSGLRESITYPDLKKVGYDYDLAGRLEIVTDWDSLLTTYTYDRGSRPDTTTLPNGLTTTYDFDDANRLETLTHAIGATTYATYGYGYDNVGNRTSMTETVLQPDATSDILFKDGFETGNLTGWSAAKTDGGDLVASTASAIAGTYGLQATLDDNNSIYLSDWAPVSETAYRARFYFDPNSISMASGDAHYIFQALNAASTVVARVEFRYYMGDYQLRAETLRDNTLWTSTGWVMLRDQMHYIEINWQAATAAGANNGVLTLWLDGTQNGTFTNLDNDTRRVDSVQFGAVSGVDTETRGTYFFDLFESRKTTYIGPDPAAPTPPAPPTPPDAIFANSFETGNLSAWSASVTDGGNLSTTTQSGIAGSYGLQALINDDHAMYVADWTSFEDVKYRARFHFDPNSIVMANYDAHYIFQALNFGNTVVAQIEFRYTFGDYQVRVQAVNDAAGWSSSPWVPITDGPHALEFNWQAATSAGANNGVLTFWVDGTQQGTITNIDNDTRRIDWIQLGPVASIDAGTLGMEYFDAFSSKRNTYIGPDPAALTPPPWPTKTDALYADGFETNNFNNWTSAVTDSGSLSVNTGSKICGTYGMNANINDNTAIYVSDWKPFAETSYRARFHFDPNTITMTSGDAHHIFYAGNADGTVIVQVEFRFTLGDYQVRAETVNDAAGWSTSSWVPITDGPHALEFYWKSATAAGANNGVFTFWVDGTQIGTWTNIDSDTRRIDWTQLGPEANIDTGTSGTEYFDCFESRRTTYIGPDPSAMTPPPWPTKTDALFADGFETGNFNNWSNAVTDNGSLSVTTTAAMKGTYGMSANINDNTVIYVSDWRPFNESTYRARFYFDPNSITMTSGDAHYIFHAGNLNGTVVTRIEFYRSGSLYQVRASILRDNSLWTNGGWRTITDAPHYLEINWKAATAAGANNGVLTFWIDGVQQDNLTTVDNDTWRVDFAQLGSILGIDTGTRGTLYFDAFESRRTTYIGPMAGLMSDDRLAFLPTLEQIRAWVDSVFAPATAIAATEPVPTPDYNQSMALSTPIAPVVAQTARDAGIGHVLAVPVPVPVSDWAAAPLEGSVSRSITYGYDDLYRLKTATYNDGTSFAYTYDAVGNRLTETTTGGLSITYIYDNANRLTSVDGITYGWDNNGNLLSDGTSSYTYDTANRLKTLTQGTTTYVNIYNGQGDRLRQTVNGVPTTYVLDLGSGLTQVLSDGSNIYLYGANRIAEKQTGGWRYYAGDALGSVRQLVDNTGTVTLAKSYQPFGTSLTSVGTGTTIYGFTGEQRDSYIKLIFLRSRYYSPLTGTFISRDSWQGDYIRPLSLNRWNYTQGNPVNFTDPSGHVSFTPYNRSAAAAYARQYASSYNEYYGIFGQSDCTNFVSQSLLAGGFPTDNTWFFDKAAWSGNATSCLGFHITGMPPEAEAALTFKFSVCGIAWALTDNLYEYLRGAKKFTTTPISGTIDALQVYPSEPSRLGATGKVIPNPMQMDKYGNFNFNQYGIREGDVILYKQNHSAHVGSGGLFNHAAIVVGWGPLTDKYNGWHYTNKLVPLVAEHSGGYETNLGAINNIHSINDTWSEVNEIVVIHIPDIIRKSEVINDCK